MLIEEVANVINFEDEVVSVLKGLQDECDMIVHSGIVAMQQFDIEHCWRLVIVAFHRSVGHWAQQYTIPTGDFSDAVAYSAGDVATPTAEIPTRFKRIMADHDCKPRSTQPGQLQKVASTRQGHGPGPAPGRGQSWA